MDQDEDNRDDGLTACNNLYELFSYKESNPDICIPAFIEAIK